mmetsp:Transcript_43556/g.69779  ORF Transcript_43556/g.69779 Transcript_43556/m.69779 type:complete len:288 (+) Transcript_43556:84-947(+)
MSYTHMTYTQSTKTKKQAQNKIYSLSFVRCASLQIVTRRGHIIWIPHMLEAFHGFIVEMLAMVRMSDTDHSFAALFQILPKQIDQSVLGDHVSNMSASDGNSASFLHRRHDLGFTMSGLRSHANHRLAVPRQGSAANKVHRATHSTIDVQADRVGHHLASDIDLQCTVDGHHIGVAANHRDVVHVVGLQQVHRRIVVDEIKHFLRANHKRRHRFAGMLFFARIGDRAAFIQRHHRIAKHFCVHAEVAMIGEFLKDVLRNITDSRLNGGAVFDESLGDNIADSLVLLK